ncbi:MAG: FG-GAP repeat protein, partial [Phycisphaerales bacterium]|nr:FG-GAP repeat protein [Phycisphaerales bacterium]
MEDGFLCPDELPFMFEFDGIVVCAPSQDLADTLAERFDDVPIDADEDIVGGIDDAVGNDEQSGPDVVFEGTDGGLVGRGIAFAGDIDGDGYDDVLMGFTEISVGAWYEGAVAIWRGGPGGPTAAPDQVIRGGERLRTLGRAVAAADVDEDGHIDLILGADRDDRGETNNGAVLIHRGLGDGSFEESPSRSLYGESSYDR